MLYDLPQEELTIKNKDTNKSKTVQLDLGFYESEDQLRILIGGEEYKLLSTKSLDERRLEAALTKFGVQEFESLAKRYPDYGTSTANLKLPEGLADAILSRLDKPGYKFLRRKLKADPTVLDKLMRAFAYYIGSTRTVDSLVKEAATRRRDEVYLVDYLLRNLELLKLFTDEQPHTKQETKELFASIANDAELDDRRPMGIDYLLNIMSRFTLVLEQHKTTLEAYPAEEPLYANPQADPKLTTLWNELKPLALKTEHELQELLATTRIKSEQYNQLTEAKFPYHCTRILKLEQALITEFNTKVNEVQQDLNKSNQTQEYLVKLVHKYITNVSEWGYEFICDRRELSPFLTKMLELQYDTPFYYLEHRSKDEQWITHLIQTISTHIPYLEQALAGKLPQQQNNAQ